MSKGNKISRSYERFDNVPPVPRLALPDLSDEEYEGYVRSGKSFDEYFQESVENSQSTCPVCKRKVDLVGRFLSQHYDNAYNWCSGGRLKAY